MPRHIHYVRSAIRYDDLKGRRLFVPGAESIMWLVVPRATRRGKVQLQTIPNGTMSETHLNTLRRWIDAGDVRILAE